MQMDAKLDQLVTKHVQSDLLVTRDIPISSYALENPIPSSTSSEDIILDLSQRPTTEITNQSHAIVIVDNWQSNSSLHYTDRIDEDFIGPSLISNEKKFNIEQPLIDQIKQSFIQASLSDNSTRNQSSLDLHHSIKKNNAPSSRIVVMHEIIPRLTYSQMSSSNFNWSTYLSLVGERSVSDEFFDHYLTSIESGFEIDMKLEYCYDLQHDLYWIAQIQLVSHSLLLLHYVGLPEHDRSHDFWACVYEKRCRPIGWCKENSKLMLPPPMVANRTIQQLVPPYNVISNGIEWQSATMKTESTIIAQTPPNYLFDKEIGLTPVEQLKVGMLLELQDICCPWTVWFVRIIENRGGRLHLRYITNINNDNEPDSDVSLSNIHIFYLDRRIHPIGWTSNDSSIYSYSIPSDLSVFIDKEKLIDACLTKAKTQFLPLNLFKEQEVTIKHRFSEGMKLEVFESKSQTVHIGRIGCIHNEHYFDVIIDNQNGGSELSFIAHSTHPHILPAHWAAEHKLPLMDGQGIRQPDDYWSSYTETYGIGDLAPERCFNLITLNAAGNNRAEPGMKMEMIYTIDNKDHVFSVTLVHVADHLMWLRVDDWASFKDKIDLYQVLPINSLEVFPVGWAKFNRFDLVKPVFYETEIKTFEHDRLNLFSFVTHYPKIPRIYSKEVYLLTIHVNIQCLCGPHICSSRLGRIPSKFGPGPYQHVLFDMYHFFLSTLSATAHRALRRLDHQLYNETTSNLKTEYIKVAKRSSKLVRPISIPNEPRRIHHYLRHMCTQLEACPNLISIQYTKDNCPDQCHILSNTFAFSTHSRHKKTQLRAAQTRYRKQKSLLCHLKNTSAVSNLPSPVIEETPLSTEIPTIEINANESSLLPLVPLPGSDRQTRGFRVHIERKTHSVTRTNKKQKLVDVSELSMPNVKQKTIEINRVAPESSSSSSSASSTMVTKLSSKESKRSCGSKKRCHPSPPPSGSSRPAVTLNILSTDTNPSLLSNKTKHKRSLPMTHSLNDLTVPSTSIMTKIESQSPLAPIRPLPYPIPPPIDPRNPITWNVNDVCWYLNESGCSFALKTIKEQEIDGAALLLLDDLNTVQDLLEFKLGPAVKFCHVVEQLRLQVIDKFHSSPALKASSCLSIN